MGAEKAAREEVAESEAATVEGGDGEAKGRAEAGDEEENSDDSSVAAADEDALPRDSMARPRGRQQRQQRKQRQQRQQPSLDPGERGERGEQRKHPGPSEDGLGARYTGGAGDEGEESDEVDLGSLEEG